MTTGLVLGKFLPPHAGHLALIDFASRMVDDLIVVVGTLAREPIDGVLRAQWMRELAPHARVVHLTDENPQDPSQDPRFWDIWRTSLQRVLRGSPSLSTERIDRVFASEPYGFRLAQELGATFVPFDVERTLVPISGTAVRRDPFASWLQLPPCVRAHYAFRVCVFGPESTGKSTLARDLGQHFDTTVAPEFARTWLEAKGGDVQASDMPIIAQGQLALEDAMARQCRKILVCDTDALSTTIWSEVLFGTVDPEVRALADSRTYDLTILCDIDVPWVADPVRYLPDERASFFRRCEEALSRTNRRTVVLSGNREDRLARAIRAIEVAMRGAF